jgi:AAA domain, putative AbiEii toxin, Type IV TA system
MEKILIYVGTAASDAQLPHIILTRSTWDDYGYKTSLKFYLVNESGDKEPIGTIKIGKRNQKPGFTPLPEIIHEPLDQDYFSLGQTEDFYENLKKYLKAPQYKRVLRQLRDVTVTEGLWDKVREDLVFTSSLSRFLGAQALVERNLFEDRVEISFSSRLHDSKYPTSCRLIFNRTSDIPGVMNAIVGKNGAGKTQLLVNFVTSVLGLDDKPITIVGRESIKKVIVVTYSIFDRFFLPNQIKVPGTSRRTEYLTKDLRYVYIGIRAASKAGEAGTRIANSATFSRRFTSSIRDLIEKNIYDDWLELIFPILTEAGFDKSDLADELLLRRRFRKLGAGHKATLSMLTELYLQIEPGTLIVVDEPENHLHPALLSTTMHILRTLLHERNSFGLVSTHSPIVIQEIPSKYVQILKRIDGQAEFERLGVESFGTSVDSLIASAFGVPADMPSYVDVLKRLAKSKFTLDDIEAELERPLSAEARSYFRSIKNI